MQAARKREMEICKQQSEKNGNMQAAKRDCAPTRDLNI